VSENGKVNRRGTGVPRLGAPCARGEARRTWVMTRSAAAVAAGKGGTGAQGELESGACVIGAGPWQSDRSSVGLPRGQVRGSDRAKRRPHVEIRKGEREGGESEGRQRQTRMEVLVSGLDFEKGRLREDRRRVGMQ